MVNKEDVIEILTLVLDNGIRVYLDGGWGVDALLGQETRAHNDIDVFIEKKQEPLLLMLLKEKDFVEEMYPYTTESHTVWKDKQGRIIDLHKFEKDTENQIVFEGEKYPEDMFDGVGRIGDIEINCIPAKYQVMFHLGYEFDENDIHDVLLLCKTFNIPIPDEYK